MNALIAEVEAVLSRHEKHPIDSELVGFVPIDEVREVLELHSEVPGLVRLREHEREALRAAYEGDESMYTRPVLIARAVEQIVATRMSEIPTPPEVRPGGDA